MWRPARVPIRYSGYPNLGQQEPPTDVAPPSPPPAERASWTTEALVGTAVGALFSAFIVSTSGKKPSASEIAAGGGTGFIVANVLRLL